MDKAMAGSTQPRHIVQLILGMPASFQHFLMYTPWDQVMKGKRYPAALADLAFGDKEPLFRGFQWGCEQGGEVRGQNWCEKFVGCLVTCQYRVCSKRICDCWWERV